MILSIRVSCCTSKTKIFSEIFFTILGITASVYHLCEKAAYGIFAQIHQNQDPLPSVW